MKTGLFRNEAMTEANAKWSSAIKREIEIYKKTGKDIRTPFARDFTRILHSKSYRRLKHKTQIFFATRNDHVCTRIEHVNHVMSVSYTISQHLGLNSELTNAIAIGHDLGHPPFGHAGELILKKIVEKNLERSFWHEKNSLRFVDKIETLPDENGKDFNLDLTYAVRDGIVLHCGEVDDTVLFPRNEIITLENISQVNEYSPYTWEGCVVKISDKISYLGRDIEDSVLLEVLSTGKLRELSKILDIPADKINNTRIIHTLVSDLCENSTPDNGLKFSDGKYQLIKDIKEFSNKNIYKHDRIKTFTKYADLIINTIFNKLKNNYKGMETVNHLNKMLQEKKYPYTILIIHFCNWLKKYSNIIPENERLQKRNNLVIYDIEDKKQYYLAVIDFISGMTDQFAIRIFNEITSF